MAPPRRRPGAQHPGTVNQSTGEALDTPKCTQPISCTATHRFAAEVEPRTDAVAAVLAAIALGTFERSAVDLARLAEATHRHLAVALEAA